MKTIATSLIIAICFGITNFSTALADTNPGQRAAQAPTFQTSFYTTTEGKLTVSLDKEPGASVEIRLLNSTGQVLFSQHVGKRKQASRLRLDVSNLPDGAYQVAVTNGVTTTLHALTLATQTPTTPSRLVAIN